MTTPYPAHVAESFARDAERGRLAQAEHTASALRRRVLAAGNGSSAPHPMPTPPRSPS